MLKFIKVNVQLRDHEICFEVLIFYLKRKIITLFSNQLSVSLANELNYSGYLQL